MKKKLRDYMPPLTEEKKQLNGLVPKSLFLAAQKILVKEKRGWGDLLLAALKQYIEETEQKGG